MFPLDRGQRLGPKTGWTLATRSPAWPIARSSLPVGAFRLETRNMSVLGDDGAALELLLDPELLREVQPLGHMGHNLPIDVRNLFAQPRDLCIAHENPPRNMRSGSPKQGAWAFTRAPPWRLAASVRSAVPARSTARTIVRPDAGASRGRTSWASRAAGLPRGAESSAGCRPGRTRARPWGESMPGPGDRAPLLESRRASRSPGGPRVRRV